MFIQFLEKLRKKPEETKRFFVWIATAVIMVIIISLWLSFGLGQAISPFNDGSLRNEGSIQEGSLNKAAGFFEEVKGDFLYLKNNLSETIGDFLSGKNEPEEIPADLQEYLIEQQVNQVPMVLPQTD